MGTLSLPVSSRCRAVFLLGIIPLTRSSCKNRIWVSKFQRAPSTMMTPQRMRWNTAGGSQGGRRPPSTAGAPLLEGKWSVLMTLAFKTTGPSNERFPTHLVECSTKPSLAWDPAQSVFPTQSAEAKCSQSLLQNGFAGTGLGASPNRNRGEKQPVVHNV